MKRISSHQCATRDELTAAALAGIHGGAQGTYPEDVQKQVAELKKGDGGQYTWYPPGTGEMHTWTNHRGETSYHAAIPGQIAQQDGSTIVAGPTDYNEMPAPR